MHCALRHAFVLVIVADDWAVLIFEGHPKTSQQYPEAFPAAMSCLFDCPSARFFPAPSAPRPSNHGHQFAPWARPWKPRVHSDAAGTSAACYGLIRSGQGPREDIGEVNAAVPSPGDAFGPAEGNSNVRSRNTPIGNGPRCVELAHRNQAACGDSGENRTALVSLCEDPRHRS